MFDIIALAKKKTVRRSYLVRTARGLCISYAETGYFFLIFNHISYFTKKISFVYDLIFRFKVKTMTRRSRKHTSRGNHINASRMTLDKIKSFRKEIACCSNCNTYKSRLPLKTSQHLTFDTFDKV